MIGEQRFEIYFWTRLVHTRVLRGLIFGDFGLILKIQNPKSAGISFEEQNKGSQLRKNPSKFNYFSSKKIEYFVFIFQGAQNIKIDMIPHVRTYASHKLMSLSDNFHDFLFTDKKIPDLALHCFMPLNGNI